MFIQYYSYDVNLENQDQLFVITGLNGSGKTTDKHDMEMTMIDCEIIESILCFCPRKAL